MAAICRLHLGRCALVGQQAPLVLSSTLVSNRDASTSSLTAVKRGRGGRSSFSGIVATVFGCTGFLGKYVINKLGKIGSQVILPYRGDAYDVERHKLSGDLGQILFFPYSITDEESLRKVMKYSNVVINLVGRDWETRNFSFHDVHVEGARRIARLAKESGVEQLIHFSSLNASPSPQTIYLKKGSQFLKTKYQGEQAVREEFPEAVIFRPADIYGAEDRFLRYYSHMLRRAHGNLPLWKKGNSTIKQPVFVSDVAEGILEVIRNPDSAGKTYDAVGPHRYYLADLADYFYSCMRWRGYRRIYLTPFFRLKVKCVSYSPSEPFYTMEKIEREHITDVLEACLTLDDLGVKLTNIADRAPYELKPYRMYAYYADKLGEFKDPLPLKTANEQMAR